VARFQQLNAAKQSSAVSAAVRRSMSTACLKRVNEAFHILELSGVNSM
jgi:hypothetical protein